MKILFINANQEKLPDPIPPLGLAYVANAACKDGHECKIFDLNFYKDFQKALADEINSFEPEIIGLSIRNVDNVSYPKAITYLPCHKKVVRVCRSNSKALLIIGGSAFSLFPEEFMRELNADYGIVGEGENLFCKLISSFNSKSRCISSNDIKSRIYYPDGDLVDIQKVYPARHLLDITRYFKEGGSINIQTKRGCCFQCSYCTYPLLEGRNIRRRDPDKVVDELENCLKDFGIDYFFFVDNVFNIPLWHAIAICQEIIQRKLNIHWTAYVSPFKVTEKMIAIFKEAGCTSLDFGTDAAHPTTLKAMGKAFGVTEIRECSRLCHKYNIKFNHSLIFGVPGETIETIEATINTILDCNPTAIIALIGVRLYRDTPLTNSLIKSNWISKKVIDIKPVFYIEETVREYLHNRFVEISNKYKNWVVPGLEKNINPRFFTRIRKRGIKGPLWEVLMPE